MRARSFAAVTTSNDRTRRQSDGYAPAVGFGTTAYRADLAGRAQPFGEHDSEWLAIAVLLEQAARLGAADGFAMLEQARRLAADVVSAAALETLVRREWQNADVHPVDPIVAVAQEAYDRNAFRTAAHILDALLAADRSLSNLQRGRLLARRARAAHKLGDLDGAAGRYAHVLRMGRALRDPGLTAHGWFGRAAVAQFHGNYPEVRRCAQRTARIADRHGLRWLSHGAHSSLMVCAGIDGRIDDALAHGWIAYRAAGVPAQEAEVLVNVSQALFDSGHVREARAGWAVVVATDDVPAHLVLPSLGGLALASAILDDVPRVRWAAREIGRLEKAGPSRYAVASALLECAMAFARIGQSALATRHATAALALARSHGFHEVAFKAESLDVSGQSPVAIRRVRLRPRGAAVARDVERLGRRTANLKSS